MEFLEKIAFNRQGLVPVIVQDIKTDEVLMMAWMNKEALEKTVNTGKVHFWSRSRIDCDEDTLLIKVEQIKAACHKGYKSCFFRKINKKGKLELIGEKVFEPGEVYK